VERGGDKKRRRAASKADEDRFEGLVKAYKTNLSGKDGSLKPSLAAQLKDWM
jgi:hypothetical protein